MGLLPPEDNYAPSITLRINLPEEEVSIRPGCEGDNAGYNFERLPRDRESPWEEMPRVEHLKLPQHR